MNAIFKSVLVAMGLLVSVGATYTHAQAPLRLGGTGAGLGTLKLLAQAYQASGGTAFTITPSLGSSGSIKAVNAGAIDLAITSRVTEQTDGEKGLTSTPFSTTPLVFAVASVSPLNEITLDKVREIYAKPLTELSPGVMAVPLLRPTHDTDSKLIMKMSAKIDAAYRSAHERRGMRIAATDAENIEDISRIPGAFGVTTLAQIKSEAWPVRALVLDAVEPTPSNLSKGTYPFGRPLYLVTRAQPAAAVQAFITFIQSPAGKQIILQNEHVLP
jgi:phosphate transport system substrate-binding protein